ncbi:MAG: quinone oxidoreductase family protein [Gammaproteobacteria bacterium]
MQGSAQWRQSAALSSSSQDFLNNVMIIFPVDGFTALYISLCCNGSRHLVCRLFLKVKVVSRQNVLSPRIFGTLINEYAAVQAEDVSHIPGKLTTEQAGVMGSDALMALRGLDDILGLKQGEALMIFGASGGIGHLAVQVAKRMGVRVLAVASGNDGVALARRLGAVVVVEGHTGDVAAAAREFGPGGLDAALITVGGEAADRALEAIRDGGRVAHPNGVMPEPKAPPGVRLSSYDVVPGQEAIDKLNRLIEAGLFEVHIARTFPLVQAAEAHRALDDHYLGKLALSPLEI